MPPSVVPSDATAITSTALTDAARATAALGATTVSPAAPTTLTLGAAAVPQASPTLTVVAPSTNGTVTYQLVVTDDNGTPSAPMTVTVTVQAAPTAVLIATPQKVVPGATVTLSGANSTAAGSGSIKSFAFSETAVTPAQTPPK